MRERRSGLHRDDLRIEWAQAHGVRQVLDRYVRLTEQDSHPAADVPRPRQVRIEHESAIDEGGAAVEVADDIAERMTAPRERDRVILAQLRRPPTPAVRFRRSLGAVQSSSH